MKPISSSSCSWRTVFSPLSSISRRERIMFPDFFCRSSSRFSFSVRSRDFPLLSCVLPVRSKAPGCCCSASYFLRMRLNCSTVTPRCNNWDTMYCWSFPFFLAAP